MAGVAGHASAADATVAATSVATTTVATSVSTAAVTQAAVQPLKASTPNYFRFTYQQALKAPRPMPGSIGIPSSMSSSQSYLDSQGLGGIYLDSSVLFATDPTKSFPVKPTSNAFFQSLGSNGRSCFTCHQPSSGMSLNTTSIQLAYFLTGGRDPMFAPVDGSNCPSSVPRTDTVVSLLGGLFGGGKQASRDSHSLLLNKGLFRVFLPVPANAEFTITVVKDPYSCNTDPTYSTSVDPVTQEVRQMISVYRRPRMSANLKFTTAPALTTLGGGPFPNIDFVTGAPVQFGGADISGNIMWDGREPTLESQALDATRGHAQALSDPTGTQIAEIVRFEKSAFAAQTYHVLAGDLTQNGGKGGPLAVSTSPNAASGFSEYSGFSTTLATNATPAQKGRASIARGQALFNSKLFTVDKVAGFNNAAVLFPTSGPVSTTCSSCHGNMPTGSDPFSAGQRDIGIGGQAAALGGPALANDLPQFQVTCKATHTDGSPVVPSMYGTTIMTNDPGLALISGKCADVGRRSVPQLRALAARAPFFSDGSAPALEDVVKVYNKRFNIGFTPTDITDLANFLEAL